jgi:hypothetical protein
MTPWPNQPRRSRPSFAVRTAWCVRRRLPRSVRWRPSDRSHPRPRRRPRLRRPLPSRPPRRLSVRPPRPPTHRPRRPGRCLKVASPSRRLRARAFRPRRRGVRSARRHAAVVPAALAAVRVDRAAVPVEVAEDSAVRAAVPVVPAVVVAPAVVSRVDLAARARARPAAADPVVAAAVLVAVVPVAAPVGSAARVGAAGPVVPHPGGARSGAATAKSSNRRRSASLRPTRRSPRARSWCHAAPRSKSSRPS